ncbi:UvrD-helicase-domain-containing protein [Gymnopus androsaceus JB14]|uniref:DNA 3'-5' helicase n=1 Tax=Gymnopus androsaceus JB14 TaxID=1447944 RepID=A0A6A4HMK4_9AGAR|nr:UvrD-helicase-domain-containing protein [Gymnopus androsaceus JB14]
MDYLKSLNPAQLRAVQHSPEIPLQILAGPGSGKTKVLTSRIAHLILHHHLPPWSICAVTFTNKAANEMKERLTKAIGKEKTQKRYARSIGLEGNFTVCDAEESKKIIAPLLKKYRHDLDAKDITLKEGTVLSLISKAKAKGLSATQFLRDIQAKSHGPKGSKEPFTSSSTVNDIDLVVAEIYEAYEKTLRKNNSLDFDDLLLFGVKLFTENHDAVKWCKHVLVDEFQDTNVTQYDLMRAIAFARCVTVVGDPDQSIYGWRSAEVGNLARMQKDFFSTEQILLEENYRSTASILKASLAIVAQDKTRIQKSLRTSHPVGPIPVLRSFPSEHIEASFLAGEIKRIVAHMGGVLNWGDFVVLLRFNALSRTIESALQKEGIPSRILGGHKFFERLEIKDLLAYLQIVDNPQFIPAFVRAINTPARGIGEKTIAELLSRADKSKLNLLELVEKIHDGKTPDIKPPIKRKLGSFVTSMRILRTLASENASPSDLIHRLVELISYEEHLRKTQPDWDTRWENVQELITFASDVQSDLQDSPSTVETQEPGEERPRDTPLRLFLQASMLSSEGDNQSKEGENECHAAKGLEWPVVMVPAVEQGTFPFYRTDDIEEERRLLYVACTRAQSLLYLSHATQRKVGGETKSKDLSVFVSAVIKENPALFIDRPSIFSVPERKKPDEVEVTKRVAEYNRTSRHRPLEYSTQYGHAYTPQMSSQGAPYMNFTSSGSFNLQPVNAAPLQAASSSSRHLPYQGSSTSFHPRPSVPVITTTPQHSLRLASPRNSNSNNASSTLSQSQLQHRAPQNSSLLRGIQNRPITPKAQAAVSNPKVGPAATGHGIQIQIQTQPRTTQAESATSVAAATAPPPNVAAGVKRRLGMGG